MTKPSDEMAVLQQHLVALHAAINVLASILDNAGVDRENRAASAKATVTYSIAERVALLVAERDRVVENARLMREAHNQTVADNGTLRARINAMVGAGPRGPGGEQ